MQPVSSMFSTPGFRAGSTRSIRTPSDDGGPRWQGQQSEESLFAQELVFGQRTPVSQSPLRLESLASLMEEGDAWVANGAEWAIHHPLDALGLVVLWQGAILVVAVGRAARGTIVIAAKYHLRRALGVPVDWLPPEDQD